MNPALIVTPALAAILIPHAPAVNALATPPSHPFGATRAKQVFSIEWAAGFADGEACIHIARQRYRNGNRSDTFAARVYITQNSLEVLEHFRDGAGIHAAIVQVSERPQVRADTLTPSVPPAWPRYSRRCWR